MDEMWGCKGLRGGGCGEVGGGAVRKVVPALRKVVPALTMAEQNGDHLLTLWLECKGHRVIRVGS